MAFVNWPSKEVRTLGAVTATFPDPTTGKELATVFLPSTPNPAQGRMHVAPSEDLVLTDWTIQDLARLHVTLGSAVPEASEPEDSGQS